MKNILSNLKVCSLVLLFAVGISVASFAQVQSQHNLFVYVWDFSTRDGKKPDLAANLTEEFEEVLIQSKRFQVLPEFCTKNK